MSWLRDFGSRNHPKTLERKRSMQKARAGMTVSEETVAAYGAARAFLLGEWFGASLSAASIALAYMLTAARTPGAVTLGTSLAVFAGGAYVFWKSRTYYRRLDFPWARRWDTAALVLAGSGAVFWLLFAVLEALAWMGVKILPA